MGFEYCKTASRSSKASRSFRFSGLPSCSRFPRKSPAGPSVGTTAIGNRAFPALRTGSWPRIISPALTISSRSLPTGGPSFPYSAMTTSPTLPPSPACHGKSATGWPLAMEERWWRPGHRLPSSRPTPRSRRNNHFNRRQPLPYGRGSITAWRAATVRERLEWLFHDKP
jgi:hypothetical protein